MKFNDYSASAVKYRFWFLEFKQVTKLLSQGLTLGQIKEDNKENNILNAKSESRSQDIMRALVRRINCLDKSYIDLFINSSVSMQKQICLWSCMAQDRLFFEFIYEVLRDKLLTRNFYLSDKDFDRFFNEKRRRNEHIGKWQDKTFTNLKSTYKSFLTESGMLEQKENNGEIIKPVITSEYKDWLKVNNLSPIYMALTGEEL